MKKVYFTNGFKGHYRTQNLLKAFIDLKFTVNISTFNFKYRTERNVFFKIIDSLRYRIFLFIKYFIQFYFIFLSDLVVIPAMNADFSSIKIAKFFNKVIIYDFYISYYDTFVIDRAIYTPKSKEARHYLKLDKTLLENTSAVFFLNKSEQFYYLNLIKPKVTPKTYLLPLNVDKRKPAELDFYNKNVSSQIFNIVWWGTYIPLHGLEFVILAIKEIVKHNKNIHFHIFGDDNKKAIPYKEIVESEFLTKYITFYDDISFSNGKLEEKLINIGHLSIGSFGLSQKARTVITNKLLDSVSLKIPVLTQASSGVLEYFNESELFYSENNPSSIAKKILYITKLSKNEIVTKVDKAYLIFEKYFSYSSMKSDLSKFLDEENLNSFNKN